MRNVSRLPFISAAACSGLCALIGLLVFWYTYANTPAVQEVSVFRPRQHLMATESKAWHMLQPEIALLFFFLMTSCIAVAWNRFMARSTDIQARYVRQFPQMIRLDMSTILFAVCCLIGAFSLFQLWDLVSRSRDIWNMA